MVIAIIQARTGSSRLPGKVLKPVLGEPMLARMLERVKRAATLDTIVVATSDKQGDDAIEALARERGVGIFRGSEDDVLDRCYKAAQAAGAATDTTLVFLTGDCPLHDPAIIDESVKHFIAQNDAQGLAGTPSNYPEGFDTDIFTFGALEEAWEHATLHSEHEHLSQYLKNHPERFHLYPWTVGERDDAAMHWSVDTERDFAFMTNVFEHLYPTNPAFTKDDILALVAQHPELLEINKGGTGYEGLAKSLKIDEEMRKQAHDFTKQ